MIEGEQDVLENSVKCEQKSTVFKDFNLPAFQSSQLPSLLPGLLF